MSIYLGNDKVCGTGVQMDNTLNSESNNAVTNAAITNALTEVGYTDWVKTTDWMDIRNGALANSIYMLVAHSVPTESGGTYTVATYPTFSFTASVSTGTNTYDVYVDGVKVATTASAATTTLDWGALYTAGTVIGGFNVTYPASLVTHIVQLTPSVSTDTLSAFDMSSHQSSGTNLPIGLLWVHFNITNAINLNEFTSSRFTWEIFEAITAVNDEVKVSEKNNCWGWPRYIKYVPWLNGEGNSMSGYRTLRDNRALKVLKLKNMTLTSTQKIQDNTNLERIDCENVKGTFANSSFTNNPKLKNIFPFILSTSGNGTDFIKELPALENTMLDFTPITNAENISVHGSSTNKTYGIKGVIVSNSAPFTGSSPQINVTYTGMDRNALVRLFNSMPTVSASQVCNITGATGAADLTAEDLAIATAKGWTITR